jgi:SH3-like domain-containing protein
MKRRLLLASLLLAAHAAAAAAEFRAVAEDATVLYDGPSLQATPLFVVTRLYPLEVLVELEAWVKVRDHTGALTWVEKRRLSESRTVLVTEPSAPALVRPEENAPVAFVAAQNVALELIEPAPEGWLRVRHADGVTGFMRAASAWGN